MANDTNTLSEQAGPKPIIHVDPPLKPKRVLSSFQVFIVFIGLLFFCALCYQNYKLGQEIAALNVKLDLQSKEIKRIKSDVADLEWEINQINTTVESIDHKIDY